MKRFDGITIMLLLAAAMAALWGGAPGPVGPKVGPRTLLILHSTSDDTPAQSRLFVTLRDGEPAKYIADKKHKLFIIDPIDDHGSVVPGFEKYQPFALPEQIAIAPPDKVLSRKPLTDSADAVLQFLKENGG